MLKSESWVLTETYEHALLRRGKKESFAGRVASLQQPFSKPLILVSGNFEPRLKRGNSRRQRKVIEKMTMNVLQKTVQILQQELSESFPFMRVEGLVVGM